MANWEQKDENAAGGLNRPENEMQNSRAGMKSGCVEMRNVRVEMQNNRVAMQNQNAKRP